MRLATPAVLVDIGRLQDLSYVREEGGVVHVGALTRHADLESSELLQAQALACNATLVIATHDQRIRARIPRHFELKAAA